MDADGSRAVQITKNTVPENGAMLSPDNSRVMFLSQANPQFEVYYNRKLFVAPSAGGAAKLVSPLDANYVRMARHVRPAAVVAVALKTNRIDEDAARAAIARTERETGLIADDPVRFGAGRILDAVLSSR